MLGLFLVTVLAIGGIGTAGNICKAKNLDEKACIQYTLEQSKADYKNLN